MLRELRVNDVVVVRDARIEPGEAFTVLTGETGAGKSVCITALRLATGQRIEGELVSPGAGSARVAAVFDSLPGDLRERLGAAGIATEDDDLLTLSREMPRQGRSVCRINGALVAQSLLRDVGEALVEITAQGASHRVVRPAWQREILDSFGGEPLQRARLAASNAVAEWRAARERLDEARRLEQSSAAEVEMARLTVTDLGDLGLRVGEDSELAAERLLLRNAAAIADGVRSLQAVGSGDDGSAADAVRAALAGLEPLAPALPELSDLVDDARELLVRIGEVSAAARRIGDALLDDPARLSIIEERLDILARVKRRHGGIEEALTALHAAQAVVAAVENDGGAIVQAEAEVAGGARRARDACAKLTGLREGAARRLEQAVTGELKDLGLPRARFRVVVRRVPDPDGLALEDGLTVRCTAQGIDEIEFRFSANAGGVPVPLDEGPSGGELSRVTLALRAVAGDDCPTLVLDEIDTGVGGETAAQIGEVLARIAARRQVIAVTHRPEIAARAEAHLLATKSTSRDGTRATVRIVEDDDRIDELARLMSGRLTTAARARARELLAEGEASRAAAGRETARA